MILCNNPIADDSSIFHNDVYIQHDLYNNPTADVSPILHNDVYDQQELCNNPIADDSSILHAEVNDPIADDSSILHNEVNGTFSGLRNLVTRHIGLKIGCLNIRGLLNKIDEMRIIVTECKFDVMGICETFLDDNVTDNEICIEGYTMFKKNRNRHGGGVLIYIKEGIQYTEITDLAGSEVEGVWANIQCDKQHLALGVIMYRAPSSNNAYLKSMLDQIDNVFSYNENIILMGDINYDYKLSESLSSNPLHQI